MTEVSSCPVCAVENPSHARFCMSCGAVLADAAPAEIIKLVTILFADVVGSSARAETMDPENVRALMSRFFGAMSEEIRREGGTVEKFIGDAVSAIFGVPVAYEDDPLRAVRAARRMLARLDELNAATDPDAPIQIRIGINTGAVSAEGSLHDHMLVVGDAVNIAARLQQGAAPGTIVAGERTARAVWGRFELTPLDPIAVKGRVGPVGAFLVGNELVSGEVVVDSRDAPLVGRAAELDILRDAWTAVEREREPRLVTIFGEPGIGKSRLVREFVAAVGEGAVVLSGRCLPFGEGVTLRPLRDILVAEAGIDPTDKRSVVEAKLVRYLEATSSGSVEPSDSAARSVKATMGLVPELEQTDPREVHRGLVETWSRLLSARADSKPVLVVIEDLHWAGDGLLDLIDEIVAELDAAVMFVCPARVELSLNRPGWATGPQRLSITLDPLTFEQSWRLTAALLNLDAEPPGFKELVLDRAEGNPFYLEEIARHLMESERVPSRQTEGLEAIDLPDRVQTLILARLDSLDPVVRGVLQRAAVIGRIFSSGALERLAGKEVSVVLGELVRRRYVVPQGASIVGEVDYKFKHVLIRDVAYESLPRRARGEAHAAAAGWIEDQRGERVEELAEVLANHYECAFEALGDDAFRRSARRYWSIAARGELRRFSIERAEDFGRRAVELSSEGLERVEALEELGDVYHLAMRGDPAWATYLAALEELEEVPDAAPEIVGRLAAKAAIVPTRWVGTMTTSPATTEVKGVIRRGLDALGDNDSSPRALLLAASAFLQGMGYEPQDEDGRAAAEEAVALARRLGDPDLESLALDAVGVWMWPEGRFGDIDVVDQERLRLVPQLGDVREICDIYLSAGRDATCIGRYHDAVEYLTRCVDRARGIDTGQYLHGLVWRVHPRFMTGDWDGALADHAEIERFAGDDEDGLPPSYTMRAHATALFCCQLRGDDAAAERLLGIVTRHFERTAGAGLTFAGPLAVAARGLAHEDRSDEAMRWLRLERWAYLGTHLEAACDAVSPDADEASTVLTMAQAEAERARLRALPFFADRLEGRIAAADGDSSRALDCFRRAAAGFAALGAPWEAAYSTLLACRVAGEPDRDGLDGQLQEALRTFDRLGSTRESAEARSLLSRASAPS